MNKVRTQNQSNSKNNKKSKRNKRENAGSDNHNMVKTSSPKIIETTDPFVLFQNYTKQCQYMGIEIHNAVRHALIVHPKQQQSAVTTSSSIKKEGGGKSSSAPSNKSSKSDGSFPSQSCVQLIIGPEEKKHKLEGTRGSKGNDNNKSAEKKNISSTTGSSTSSTTNTIIKTTNKDQYQLQQEITVTNSGANGNTGSKSDIMIMDNGITTIDDEQEVLGDGGCRALVAAILGEVGDHVMSSKEPSITSANKIHDSFVKENAGVFTVYTAFQEIRIWRSRIGNDGSIALARLLNSKCRLSAGGTGAFIKINLLDLLGNEIGPRGALALGRSLCMGMNNSLLSLKLDFNRTLGCDGVVALSKGLKLNNTLKFLSLKFCGIGVRGGAALSGVLSFPRTAVESLDLEGNPLGGQGLEALCLGLKINNRLQKLSLADIHILPTTDDAVLVSMQIFGDAIAHHKTLIEVNLLRNILGEAGGSELLKHVKTNSKIQSLLVEDTKLPPEIYISLCRTHTQPPQKGASKKKRTNKKGSKKK